MHSSAWVEVSGTLEGFATGGLTGRMNNSWIQNSSVTGTTQGRQAVGGLVGYADNLSLVERSYNTGSIIASLDIAGGLIGRLQGGTVRDSYSTGTIQSGYFCGGAIGFSQFPNLVERVFATGIINCIISPMAPPSGGLIGWSVDNTVVNSSYFDEESTGIPVSPGGGEGRTTLQMKQQATFSGWNFSEVWQTENEGARMSYPFLRDLYWQELQPVPGLAFHTSIDAPAGWQILSSPAAQTTYGELLAGIWTQGYPGSNHPESNQPSVFWYDETQPGAQWQLPGDSSYLAGTGSAAGSNAGRATLAYVFGPLEHNGPEVWPKPLIIGGAEQNQTVSLNLTRTSETGEDFAGWHLIGNPFADSFDWAGHNGAQQHLEPVIYSWDKAAQAHRFVDGITGGGTRPAELSPFEGFWVRVAAGQNNGVFTAIPAGAGGMQRKPAEDDEKAVPQATPVFLTLEVAQGEHFERAVIQLLGEGDGDGNEAFYERPFPLGVPVMQFVFSREDGPAQASVQRSQLTEGVMRSFPLAFDATLSGNFTLSLSGSEGWEEMIEAAVVDHHTGEVRAFNGDGSMIFAHQPSAQLLQLREQSKSVSPAEILGLARQSALLNTGNRFGLRLTKRAPTSLIPGEGLPSVFTLQQNYPNPFNPTTTIRYALPEPAQVRLEVYNALGQRVAVLVNGQQSAGWHTASFDAGRLSSGLYLYRLQAGSYTETRSMMLVK